MKNKINVAELLKDCPKGMELDCTMFENVTFARVDMSKKQFPIEIVIRGKQSKYLTKEGCFHDVTLLPDAKCVIFPKGKTTWEGFVPPYKFKDGDVVVAEDSESFQLFLLKHLTYSEDDNDHNGYCYFGWDFQFNSLFEKGYWGFNRLATEEEKQKLFDAIKSNGYHWNDETKTLEKLIEPKFKVGNKIRLKSKRNHVYTIHSLTWDNNKLAYRLLPDNDKHLRVVSLTTQDDYELVPNKFDINTLVPFESKVLVRDKNNDKWIGQFFSHYDNGSDRPYVCIGIEGLCEYKKCIPFKNNEYLLGKTDDCDEYYKTWC